MARKSKLSLCVKLVPEYLFISDTVLCEVDIGKFFFCVYIITESLEAGGVA